MAFESVSSSSHNRGSFKRASTSKQRSKVTNNASLLPNTDGRLAIARRFKDIASQILVDTQSKSEVHMQLARRFAAAACIAEEMESRLARGEQISIVEHCQLSSTMVRLANRLGVDRVAKEVDGIEEAYLQGWRETEAEAAE